MERDQQTVESGETLSSDQADAGGLGPELTENAKMLRLSPYDLMLRMLFNPFNVYIHEGTYAFRALFITGRTFAGNRGPSSKQAGGVMIIGKMPGKKEQNEGDVFVGPSGKLLEAALQQVGAVYRDWYLTNVVRFAPPGNQKKLKSSWLAECMPLLKVELEILKPKHILVLGSDAAKALMGKGASVARLRGAEGIEYNGAQVSVTVHPAAICKDPSLLPGMLRDLADFADRVKGTSSAARKTEYIVISRDEELTAVVDTLLAAGHTRYAVDCEWGGTDGTSFPKGLLRTIQFTPVDHKAYCVVLRRCDLVEAEHCSEAHVRTQLTRLFCRPGVKLDGHFIRADMLRLKQLGIPCDEQICAGRDTMLMYHLLQSGEEGFGLENLTIQFTDLGRYDLAVETWLSKHGMGSKAAKRKYGYGKVPDDILHPYACADVDVVIRCGDLLEQKLRNQRLDEPYELSPGVTVATMWDFYREIVHQVTEPLHEMEWEGIPADADRLRHLTEVFVAKQAGMVKALRAAVQWPDYNFRSVDQTRELLFGTAFGGQAPVHPEGAKLLHYEPITTTDVPARDWAKVPDAEKASGLASPSVGAETLTILAFNDPVVEQLRKLKFVDQIIKNFLRPPAINEETNVLEWHGGLVKDLDANNRIHTTLSQITTTGRYRSFQPNLQNLPKKQEVELRQIFSPDVEKLLKCPTWANMPDGDLKALGLLQNNYYQLRSCFVALPGHILVEADYVQAELFILAYISGDPNMMAIMEDSKRNLHSEMAVNAFRLDCDPSSVKELFPKHYTMAKSTNFGIAYGRGAFALARQLRTQGVEIGVEEAQELIDKFYEMFPCTRDYIKRCHNAIENPGYVQTLYGRRRYFYPPTDDSFQNRGIIAAQQREAQNMPIQGTIGDALSVALTNIFILRNARNMRSKLILPIHDAVMLHVPVDEIDAVTRELLPVCMSESVNIPTISVKLKIDITYMRRWGEKMKRDAAVADALAH